MTCAICNDTFIVIVGQDRDSGQFDADDCPCQEPGYEPETEEDNG
jgi:hypothetical protein